MHVPDGFLSIPVAATTAAVSLAAVGYSARKATRALNERAVPLLGVTAAFVFAAQMLNFPVAGGTSGHFLGAVFVAVLLGPYAAVVVMTAVLAVQALGMADGGITALGANVLNMALIAGVGGYLVFLVLNRLLPKRPAMYFLSVAVASWLSVVLAAAACSLELALSGTVPLSVALAAMTSVHMIIGLGEALITVSIVAAVLAARPDLVATYTLETTPGSAAGSPLLGRRARLWVFVLCAVVVSLALAVLVSPFASSSPDGLAKVAVDKGFAQTAAAHSGWSLAPLGGYSFPGIGSRSIGTAVAGAIGTIALFALLVVVGRLLGRKRQPEPPRGLGRTERSEVVTPEPAPEP